MCQASPQAHNWIFDASFRFEHRHCYLCPAGWIVTGSLWVHTVYVTTLLQKGEELSEVLEEPTQTHWRKERSVLMYYTEEYIKACLISLSLFRRVNWMWWVYCLCVTWTIKMKMAQLKRWWCINCYVGCLELYPLVILILCSMSVCLWDFIAIYDIIINHFDSCILDWKQHLLLFIVEDKP